MFSKQIQENTYPFKFSIVIPAYNEEHRIEKTIEYIQNALATTSCEILVIDDGSTDKTRDIINSLLKRFPSNLKNIILKENFGKGFAIKQGFLAATGEFILMTDADVSTPIETLFELENELKEYDVLIGSRLLKSKKIIVQGPFSRKIVRFISRVLRKFLFNVHISDTQCGFKIFRNKAAKEIASLMTINRYGADLEKIIIARRLNYKIKEVPVSWIFDKENSKINLVRDSYRTFKEWLQIRVNIFRKKY